MLASQEPETRAAAHVIGPVVVPVRTSRSALRDIGAAVATHKTLRVAFANTNLVYHAARNPPYAAQLRDFYMLNDGVGLTLLSKLSCGEGFAENLNGTDFTPRLLAAMAPGVRVYLVGAKGDVTAAAKTALARAHPHLMFCGAWDGFSAHERRDDVVADIHARSAQIVLVAMGNPLQESWIAAAAAAEPGLVWLGVGALFDYVAGAKPRAPAFYVRWRLEWLHRLMTEPRRLWRRYTIEAAYVVFACMKRRGARPPWRGVR